jgi:hypothetical protein
MNNETKKNNTILEAAVLLLLIGLIYEVHHWDGLTWHNIYTKFREDRLEHSGNIKVIISIIWEVVMLILLMRGIS